MFLEIVTEEKRQYYNYLIPKEFESRIGIPGIIVVGASLYEEELVEKKQDEEAKKSALPEEEDALIPAGVMALSLAALDTLEILWLAVNPEYQEREIASALLKEAFKLAKRTDTGRLLVGVPKSAEEYAITKRFFVSRGFSETNRTYREWNFVPKDIADISLETSGDDRFTFVPYGKLPKDVRDEVIQIATAENLDSPFALIPEFIDPKGSMVYMEDDEPVEGILVLRPGSVVGLVFFETDEVNYECEEEMIRYLLREVIGKLKGGVLVNFRVGPGMPQLFLTEALSGIPYLDMTYLTADANSFEEAEEAIRIQALRETLVEESEEAFPEKLTEKSRELAGGEIIEAV